MKYKDIVSVTGLSGLYQLLTTKSDGAIVRSIGDKAIKFISARQHNVTPLESIEVYTIGDNVRLQYLFEQLRELEKTAPLIDLKKATKQEITEYFRTLLPDFDEDKVYVSDMKKIIKWYDLLKTNDLLDMPTEAGSEQEPENDVIALASIAATEVVAASETVAASDATE